MSLIKEILKATGIKVMLDLDEKIPDMDTPWEGYLGERVEEFLKEQIAANSDAVASKAGCIALIGNDKENNTATVGLFRTESEYNAWKADPEGQSELLLSSAEIPMGSGGGTSEVSYIVKLANVGAKTITATKTADLVAKLRITSQQYDPSDGSTSDTNETATIMIETKMEGASQWKQVGTISQVQTQEAADTATYTTIDLAPYIASGTQSVRFLAVGESTEKKSQYVNMTVTLTDVGITFMTNWQEPFIKNDSGKIVVPLKISGTINKELHIRVTGTGYSKSYDFAVGRSTYTETPYSAGIQHPNAHGIFKVEAWITSGDTVRTDTVSQNIMCVLPDSDIALLAINDVAHFQNWSDVTAFRYAVYNPKAETTDVHFHFATVEDGILIHDETVTGVANNASPRSLTFGIEVETGDNIDFSAKMTFTDGEGSTLLEPLVVDIDNSENYAPTADADLIINPKTRSNSEEQPDSIVNAKDGSTLQATFENIHFTSDGWVVDESTNTRCLRVLDGGKVNIAYDAYSDKTATDGLTIEVDFATRNVTNTDGHLFDMNTTKAVDGLPIGLWLMAQEGCFMTDQKRTFGFQNVTYSQDTRTHLAVNIVPNLYGQGINYVRIFVNGIIYREFTYAKDDKFWQSVDGEKKSGGISICPSGADIDVFSIRVYKKSISAQDIRQDYLASMATVAEKKDFKEKNDILGENGLISYAKSYEKYNTLLYKGKVPTKMRPEPVKLDLVIHKPGDPSHSGTLYSMDIKGQGSTSKNYMLWNLQSDFKSADSKWVDENGEDHGQCYQNADGLPKAKKLVDKRNWASSSMSHKMGATKMYNDLYKAIVGKNEITSIEGKENCRVAVYEEPFLVFEQEGDAEPTYIGMGTFGSGKADKPTFGYSSSDETKDMLMIEGSDNNPRLTKHQVPWIDGDVTYSAEEGFVYAGITSWDYDMGNLDTASRFQDAFNFVYLHSDRLKPFEGTLSELRAKADTLDVSYQYWVTIADTDLGSARYDAYRYEEQSKEWVPAGAGKNDDGSYVKLNVKTQMSAVLPSAFASHESKMAWDKVNEDFISARISDFASNVGSYFHKRDIIFFMAMMRLIAASDNRAKNTYLWVFSGSSLIRAMQDDLDTIFAFDNQGLLKKPYWVEEHDKDDSGVNYWNGEDNVLYNLFEEAFGDELRQMMNEILTQMASIGGSVMGFFEKYFLSTCQYFPAVAYNEWARIGYEAAKYQMEQGNYTNDTDPITQSLGSQEEGERQWMRDRTVYMSSYALYGEFAAKPSTGSITYRSNKAMTVRFNLTTAMWLYPVIVFGETITYFGNRCKAGETITYDGINGNNTQNTICGVNYLSDIGTWYDKPADGSLAFNGKRIKTLVAGTDNTSAINFKVTGVTLNTLTSLRSLDMHNIKTLVGNLDISKLSRLESADLRGTSITTLSLPQQEFLASIRLPSTMTSIRLDDQQGLETLEFEGCEYLQSVYLDTRQTSLDIKALITTLMEKATSQLSGITLLGVYLQDMTAEMLRWLLDRKAVVTGDISMATGAKVDYELKTLMLTQWGNVDDEKNDVCVLYKKVAMEDFTIKGKYFCTDGVGKYQYRIVPGNTSANDFTAIAWSITDNPYATIDPKTGVLNVTSLGTNEEAPMATITASVTTADGTMSKTFEVGLYDREPQVGDYVYSDGSVLPIYHNDLTVMGVIFFIRQDIETGKKWKYVCPKNYVWPVNVKGCFGIDSATFPDLKLADDEGYDLFDLPNDNSTYTGDAKSVDVDGRLKSLTKNLLTNNKEYDLYAVGDLIPAGLWNTLAIINARNKLLTDSSVGRTVPAARDDMTEAEVLEEYMALFIESNGNNNSYAQYYFPHASRCYAYEPTVKDGETLAERFKAHHWWCPSGGELKAYMVAGNTGLFDKNIRDGYLTFNKSWTISSSECYGSKLKRVGVLEVYYGYDFVVLKSQCNEVLMPITAFSD